LDWEQTPVVNPVENLIVPNHKPVIKKGWKPKVIDGGKS